MEEQSGTTVTTGFLEVNGARFYYESAGSGPALLLIHGYGLDGRMWADQVAVFARQYRVINVDLRGFGRSSLPDSPFSYHEDLKAVLEALGVESAVIIGQSLGGAIAIDFALAFPDATIALIAVDTSGLNGYPWLPELDRWFQAMAAAAQQGDFDLAKQRWLDTDWFTPARRQPAVAAQLAQIVADYSGWHFANDNPVRGFEPPAYNRLETIISPTLIVTGELDLSFYNLPIADAMAQRIPGARHIVLPDVGHMSNMEDPAGFNNAVLSFIDQKVGF